MCHVFASRLAIPSCRSRLSVGARRHLRPRHVFTCGCMLGFVLIKACRCFEAWQRSLLVLKCVNAISSCVAPRLGRAFRLRVCPSWLVYLPPPPSALSGTCFHTCPGHSLGARAPPSRSRLLSIQIDMSHLNQVLAFALPTVVREKRDGGVCSVV